MLKYPMFRKKCKQELMLNPHTPSELLEEKLHHAGLTDMPHPKKLHLWCSLSVGRGSMEKYHCEVTPWVFTSTYDAPINVSSLWK